MPRFLRDVITQDDHMVCGDLIKVGGGRDALAAQVHIGQRLEQHDPVFTHLRRAVQPLPFGLGDVAVPLCGQIVQCFKPGIVAGAVILGFGVAQPGNEPVCPGGHSKHRYIL